jgi:hypothetical protein
MHSTLRILHPVSPAVWKLKMRGPLTGALAVKKQSISKNSDAQSFSRIMCGIINSIATGGLNGGDFDKLMQGTIL